MSLPTTVPPGSDPALPAIAPPRRIEGFRNLLRNRRLVIGAVALLLICCAAIFAPLLTGHDPIAQDLGSRLQPPIWSGGSTTHLFGTDEFGRDVLSRLLYGARYSLTAVAISVVLAGLLGVTLGIIASYRGGRLGAFIMRATDTQQALPSVLIALMVVAVFGANLLNLVIILTVAAWVPFSRVTCEVVRQLRSREFITAAVALGASKRFIIIHHVLRNILSPITVLAAIEVGRVLLLAAGLSFLGLGIPEPLPDWGSMLATGQKNIFTASWLTTIPGLAVTLTVLSVNLLGDGLRTLLDPRANRSR